MHVITAQPYVAVTVPGRQAGLFDAEAALLAGLARMPAYLAGQMRQPSECKLQLVQP